ncbi:thiamine phosphate synthase [Azorhizobium doebereinerae]|uniref:thiamine phosphate synthase n=1 Tax=Azorhizobium doebereinerae TaxID=281091 RepID=UPI0018DE70EA|nr:thiamine phosphate synthase [Azorhizobium doebereinerae]
MPSDPVLPRCRLMLVLPPALPAEAAAAWVKAGDVAAVIATLPAGGEVAALETLRALCETVQAAGAAFLVEDRPDIAGAIKADGVHVASLAALARALKSVKPDGIAGVGLSSRHDAMEAGEAGADYLLFGGLDGSDPIGPVADLVNWWAELFEVPCVGVATTLEDAQALAAAGADFIALAALPDGADGAALIAAVDRHLASLERGA